MGKINTANYHTAGPSKKVDENKQSNKRHNKTKDKLVVKKKYKKNKQKFAEIRSKLRDIKKAKEIYIRQAMISDRFNQKVHSDEIHILQSIVKKLIDHNQDSKEDLPVLFESLDQKAAVDISGIDDTYVQAKLFKIFKIMRLRKSKDNQLEFRKKSEKEIHDFNFKRFINFVIT